MADDMSNVIYHAFLYDIDMANKSSCKTKNITFYERGALDSWGNAFEPLLHVIVLSPWLSEQDC